MSVIKNRTRLHRPKMVYACGGKKEARFENDIRVGLRLLKKKTKDLQEELDHLSEVQP